jgi:hypothetical protein
MPCTVEVGGRRRPGIVTFSLDLHCGTGALPGHPQHLRLSLTFDGWPRKSPTNGLKAAFSDWRPRFPPGTSLVCCVTCPYSDCSPGRHGSWASAVIVALRSSTWLSGRPDYWSVPVTEEVPETYLCREYQRRIPGTRYRR